MKKVLLLFLITLVSFSVISCERLKQKGIECREQITALEQANKIDEERQKVFRASMRLFEVQADSLRRVQTKVFSQKKKDTIERQIDQLMQKRSAANDSDLTIHRRLCHRDTLITDQKNNLLYKLFGK